MFMQKETDGYHHHNPTMMSSSSCASSSAAIGFGYIQHPISKLDTLAGIAIKYGVESPRMNTSEQKLSSGMSSSQGYYGTVPAVKESIREVLEIVMCRQGSSNSSENASFYANSRKSDRPQSHHKKSRSLAERNVDDILESSDKWIETIAKNLEDDPKDTPELLLRQDSSNSSKLSSRTGKGLLAQRQKNASRITLTMGVGDAYTSSTSSVRKSSSTSCLQGNDNNSIYMRTTSRKSLKPDLIASTASMAKPILSGGRNKAALD